MMKIRWMMMAAVVATMAGCPEEPAQLPLLDAINDFAVADASDGSADTTPDVAPDVDPDTADIDPDTALDVDPDINPDSALDVDPDINPDIVADVDPDVDPDVVADVDPDVVADVDPDVVPDGDTDTTPDSADSDVEQEVVAPVCGDNNVDAGETCDDGNTDDGDYCSADCQTVTGSCGDGIRQINEPCDGADTGGKLCAGTTIPAGCDSSCAYDYSACPGGPGTFCTEPHVVVDGTNELLGTFEVEPTGGFSCDTTPNNAVWFAYTATSTGSVTIDLENATTTTTYTRLVVFDGLACDPTDSELACESPSSKNVSTAITVVSGNSYLIAAATDGETYTMVAPTITIIPDVCGDNLISGAEVCDGTEIDGAVCSDGVTLPTCDASCQLDLSGCPVVPGAICETPEVVVEGPNTLTGTFGVEPNDGVSCDSTPTNAAWFAYTATTDGSVNVAIQNTTTTSAYTRIVVFDGLGCNPTNTELVCVAPSSKNSATDFLAVNGNDYMIAVFTDGNTFTLIDPTITITPAICGDDIVSGAEECDGIEVGGETCLDPEIPVGCTSSCTFDTSVCPTYPGDSCANPLDVTGSSFPLGVAGFFGDDSNDEISCTTTTANIVWFQYTAPSTGDFEISVLNATTTNAYSRLAVFDGAECPDGNEVFCETSIGKSSIELVPLEMGKVYLIAFGTDGDSYTMIDPRITITPIVCGNGLISSDEECDGSNVDGALCDDGVTPAVCTGTCTLDFSTCPILDGTFCAAPQEVFDGVTALTGTFNDDPANVFSCEATPTNVAWFSYTAIATGDLVVEVENATTTAAFTRLVVLDGVACDPLDAELACEAPSSKNVSTIVPVVSGNSYLFVAVSDGDSYTMVDPTITIAPLFCGDDIAVGDEECDGIDVGDALCTDGVTPAGCSATCTLEYTGCPVVPGEGCVAPADPTEVPLVGVFVDDPAVVFSCDDTPTNVVWYQYTAAFTGDIEIDATNSTTTNAFSRIVVLDGVKCDPFDAELVCSTAASKSITTTAPVVDGNDYLIGFFTDGNNYSMIEPTLTVTPIVCGDDVVNGDEECDGLNVGDALCIDGTTPAGCTASCTLDFTACPEVPGALCTTPSDVTLEPSPFVLTGSFGDDSAEAFGCDTTPTNIVWYDYTASMTGEIDISATNSTLTTAYSRLVVFDGVKCDPLDPELVCDTADSKSITTTVSVIDGNSYRIGFFTDGNAYTMIDPSLTITPVVCGDDVISGNEECDGLDVGGTLCSDGTTPAVCTASCTLDFTGCPDVPGELCTTPADATSGPVLLTGSFSDDSIVAFSCDDTPTNIVWYEYTASATGDVDISGVNNTSTNAYSRLVVLDGLACGPYDVEVACEVNNAKNVTATVPMVDGNTYLIGFFTDGQTFTMIDPELSIVTP